MEQMTVQEVINIILVTATDAIAYLIPILVVMAAIHWLVGFLIFALFGVEKKTFGR
jgi:hypothetical protein